MTVTAFVFSCIALPFSILGSVLGLLTYRRSGVHLKIRASKARLASAVIVPASPPRDVLVIEIDNTGMAATQIRNPHFEIEGESKSFLPVSSVEDKKVEGLSSAFWHFDSATLYPQLGVLEDRPRKIRPVVLLPGGKKVRGQWLTVSNEDLQQR